MNQNLKTFAAKNRKSWRDWLEKNHNKEEFVWLVYYKKQSGIESIIYSDAVDEALCFGWIDSKSKPIDENSYMQYFCKRKSKSVWSKVNKEKVQRLINEGLMHESGYKIIEEAKLNGSWNILDDAEALVIPQDLEVELKKLNAFENFNNFSRSDKRNILQWLVLAKKAETRTKRITEISELAAINKKPKQFS